MPFLFIQNQYRRAVPTFNFCTKCKGSPGTIQDRTPACHPFSGHGCMDDLETERSFDLMLRELWTCYPWVFVQPISLYDSYIKGFQNILRSLSFTIPFLYFMCSGAYLSLGLRLPEGSWPCYKSERTTRDLWFMGANPRFPTRAAHPCGNLGFPP